MLVCRLLFTVKLCRFVHLNSVSVPREDADGEISGFVPRGGFIFFWERERKKTRRRRENGGDGEREGREGERRERERQRERRRRERERWREREREREREERRERGGERGGGPRATRNTGLAQKSKKEKQEYK
eukprot:scaffold42871_cov19-Tisochrysis_lutea.AAC.1